MSIRQRLKGILIRRPVITPAGVANSLNWHMRFLSGQANQASKREMPAHSYISVVVSLSSDAVTLFVGSLATSLIALLSAVKTGQIVFAVCAVLIAGLAGARAYDVAGYGRRHEKPTTAEA